MRRNEDWGGRGIGERESGGERKELGRGSMRASFQVTMEW